MTTVLLGRNRFFYPLLFGVWALFLLIRFGDHRYFDTPISSAGFERISGGLSKASLLRNSITELRKNLAGENRPGEKPHLLQNIGCDYSDLYRQTGDRQLLDSAFYFVQQSIVEGPGNARFHYNLGRLFTEIADGQHALQQYDLALRYDSAHVLALSNAGTCSYFVFGQRKAAAAYFDRALKVDSLLPMCHVVMGLMSLDDKKFADARFHFDQELSADEKAFANLRYPLSEESIRFAASIAHHNLMLLYSTRFPDKVQAQKHFDDYVNSEPDPAKRTEVSLEMKKYWGKK